jgi:4-amino-4-deoxy-L-arabinose transferase-like glycosyltransferase
VNRRLLLAAPLLLVYVAVGWGRTGPLFAPLEALRTTTPSATDPSKLARNEEDANLVHTFRQNPVLGSGWGHPYQALTTVYSEVFKTSAFVQYAYLPHNSLFGMLAFSGVVGFVGTWLPVPVAAFLAARGYRRAKRTTDRAAAMAAVCVLPAFGVQAFGDLGFNSLEGWLIVALAAATGGRVAARTRAWPSRARSSTRAGPALPDAPGTNVASPASAAPLQ